MRLNAQSHCSIVGLPRMGKTSVAKELLRTRHTDIAGSVSGYITLDAIRSPAQAYNRMLEELAPDASSQMLLPRLVDHDQAYEHFLRNLRKLCRSGQKSTLVIDEIDAVRREDFTDASLFISRIREVANDRDRYGVTFVFVSRRSLDMIQGAVNTSTLAGLCEVIYLQPLTRDGLDELIARSPIPVSCAGREALWRITGGHPYLAEVVMCEAVDRANSLIDDQLIESAQHIQSHEFTNQYQQLANLLTQEQMFDALCELVVGPQWRPISPHVVALLKHYGIIRGAENIVGGVDSISQHFGDYLALVARTAPSWSLLGDAERQLRYLIQDRMCEAYGENWLDILKSKLPQKAGILEKLSEQRFREKRMFGDAASDFILDYAYISDLKDLIFAEWDRYREILGGAKSEWEKRFQQILKVRNPMAHHRPVPADVLHDAEQACKALLYRLKGKAVEHSED